MTQDKIALLPEGLKAAKAAVAELHERLGKEQKFAGYSIILPVAIAAYLAATRPAARAGAGAGEVERRVQIITDALLHLPVGGAALQLAARQVEPALRSIPPDDGWRTIDSAPKDKLVMLGLQPHPGLVHTPIKVGGWREDWGRWEIFGASWKPTHWRLLPPPPEAV